MPRLSKNTTPGGSYSTPDPEWLRLREQKAGIPQSAIICDFCSARNPTWDYENYPTDQEDGGWAACDICHDIIESGDRQKLLDRSCGSAPMGSALDGLRRRIEATHRLFWENRKEPARRIED